MTETIELEAAADSSPKRRSLSVMRLAELQSLASGMGISGTARMRKNDLITAIREAQGNSDGASGAAEPSRGSGGDGQAADRDGAEGASASDQQYRPQSEHDARHQTHQSDDRPSEQQHSEQRPAAEQRTDERSTEQQSSPVGSDGSDDSGSSTASGADQADSATRHEGESSQQHSQRPTTQRRESGTHQRDSAGDRDNRRTPQQRDGYTRRPREDHDDDRGGTSNRRRSRQRSRDRKRRGSRPGEHDYQNDTVETVSEDDVLVPVAGILDVLENYAFVRTSGYLPGSEDVYVPLGMVRRHGLRKGDAVTGAVRALREGEQPPTRQKFNALVRLDTVNGMTPEQARQRVEFNKLTPLYPQERLRLETEVGGMTTRIIDLVSPIGKGQRGLIVSPPKAGKTMVLQAIANAIAQNNPECHLMIVLVDERPEEVTDFQRTVKGEVIASTFDRPASDHTVVAELAIERAKRLVEMGHDVVVLLDGITRLGRAYNLAAPASGRILSGGVDSSALYPPKKFFGAARNIENGGSLTILATALVETGSKMDEVIFEEFKGTGNMELRLSRQLADRRIFPAIDATSSGTRREEILMGAEELKIMWKLRRVLSALDAQQGIELLLNRLKKTKSNVEFLMLVQKTSNIHIDDD